MYLTCNISNIPGWSTKRKIVVIESDDWGSIRMPSVEVFNILQKEGLDLASGSATQYNRSDTLASAQDFEALYDVLRQFKDKYGNHPVFTVMAVVANPDFEKIRRADFREYFYEPFTQTLRRYGRENAFQLWQYGIRKRLFIPQFHSREHLNVAVWMRALQANDRQVRLAFDQGFWGFNNKHPYGLTFQAAFDLEYTSDLIIQKEAVQSGLVLFEKLFGYKASFFVPPNGPFNNSLEKVAVESGIRYLSAAKIQKEVLGQGRKRTVFHWLGQKGRYGQYYLTRNCFFEPSQPGKDWVSSCLKDIQIAFRWHKPAIISSHRVNYIGGLIEGNRNNGLRQLKQLLTSIIKYWPDAEFMTSADLGALISK